MKDLLGLMGKAKEMQAKFQAMQEEIAEIEATGQSGGGLVSVTLSGKFEMRSLKIDPSLFKAGRGRDPRGPDPRRAQRRQGQGRGGHAGKDPRADRRPAAAAGHEAAVLNAAAQPTSRSMKTAARRMPPGSAKSARPDAPESEPRIETLGRQARHAFELGDAPLPGVGAAVLDQAPRHALPKVIGMRGEMTDMGRSVDDLAAVPAAFRSSRRSRRLVSGKSRRHSRFRCQQVRIGLRHQRQGSGQLVVRIPAS